MERDDPPSEPSTGSQAEATETAAHTDASPAAETPPSQNDSGKLTIDEARVRLIQLLQAGQISEKAALQMLLKDHDGLRDKTSKLKSLLGRSAKAQREAKVDLEATQKRLDQALREIERLNKKIDKLANRPTHMELLADFETNFDRALLSVGKHQSGGEDTAPPTDLPNASSSHHNHNSNNNKNSNQNSLLLLDPPADAAVVDGMLMQELADSKQRIEKLESLNAALVHRSSQLEGEVQVRTRERDDCATQLSRLELEKRMAELEAERAVKEMEQQAASCAEMQMEIDLVTKASVTANARAAQGEQIIKTVQTDRQNVHDLEAKVQALQEWALASSEAKTLAQERVRFLENQLKSLQRSAAGEKDSAGTGSTGADERVLMSQKGSFVVGAGDSGARVFTLSSEDVKTVRLSERVVLRWHFDLSSETCDIAFSVMRGACETPELRTNADCIIKKRMVQGGAAGETENAFTSQRACTLEWDNSNSWIRPRTVKFEVEAVVLTDGE